MTVLTPENSGLSAAGALQRVLAICPQLSSGGAERQLVCLCRHINRQRFDVHVVYYEAGGPLVDELKSLGIRVTHVDRTRLSWMGLVRALRREVAAFRPHVIDCRLPSGYRFGRLAALGSGAVVVAEERTIQRSAGPRRLLDKWLNRWTDAWVGNSTAVAGHISRDMGVARERVHVIYNGIDVAWFSGVLPDTGLAEICGAGRRVILNLGSLVPAKNQRLFLRVGEKLLRRHPEIILVFCGDGPLREALETEARELGIADQCRFLGQRSDVGPVLAAASVVVQTSDEEGLPNAVMEAMAAGRPVVATEAGGTRELLEHGVDGFLVGVGDESALVERISAVLADGAMAARLGQAAAEKIRTRFSAAAMAVQYEELFTRLIAEKGMPAERKRQEPGCGRNID
jgi:glycosyltransferase involved in cell wall biosynthesis